MNCETLIITIEIGEKRYYAKEISGVVILGAIADSGIEDKDIGSGIKMDPPSLACLLINSGADPKTVHMKESADQGKSPSYDIGYLLSNTQEKEITIKAEVH